MVANRREVDGFDGGRKVLENLTPHWPLPRVVLSLVQFLDETKKMIE
ncbi:uncharacterized protein G2W53_014750 [Senna tora]|uniref:Uncharacterized protein n=1 Tax=Senna tora TaxID=362788 RepID=A0A834WU59_9FABA|nr:uncharacterized protein G2W53_014750 [Senna tora]